MTNETRTVRPSPIAGTWYSDNPRQLRDTVDGYLEKADIPSLPGEVVALVAPHAGYRYSGTVAGHAFKTVKGKSFPHVIVISPMHQYHPQPILTSAHRAYQTPLGEVPLADEMMTKISNRLRQKIDQPLSPVANDQEHSLEIELPFLQQALQGRFELIPIMLRDQSRQVARALGEVLADTIRGKDALIVASSDLSHFYSESEANQLDNHVLNALMDFSPEVLFDLKDQGIGQACGLAAIATALWASRAVGADQVTLLSYDTSASSTGDSSSVVGYAAAAVTRPG